MKVNEVMLKDALHHATPEEAGHKATIRDRSANVAHGRGVLIGLVSGLMATGIQFDDAWQLCLRQGKMLLPDCIPPSWPTAADYEAAGKSNPPDIDLAELAKEEWTPEDLLRREG